MWPASRLFFIQLVDANVIKASKLRTVHIFWRDSTIYRWIPHTKGQLCGERLTNNGTTHLSMAAWRKYAVIYIILLLLCLYSNRLIIASAHNDPCLICSLKVLISHWKFCFKNLYIQNVYNDLFILVLLHLKSFYFALHNHFAWPMYKCMYGSHWILGFIRKFYI